MGTWSERTVRPLELTRQGSWWYLRAYCLCDSAERTFRVDRIGSAQSPRSLANDNDDGV